MLKSRLIVKCNNGGREANREQENATRRAHRNHHQEYMRNQDQLKEAAKKRYRRLKQKAITLLGGRCVRCHLDDMRCLEIDHIIPEYGDRSVYGIRLYQSIVTWNSTVNLQVLCANCHAIKTYEDGNGVA